MAEWWKYLKGRPFYWALDGVNPAATLFMIRHVVERPSTAPARRAARLALNEDAGISALCRTLGDVATTDGYESLLWRLRLLAELGVRGQDECIAEALDRLLDAGPSSDQPAAYDALLIQIAAQVGYPDEPRVLAAQARLAAAVNAGRFPEEVEARADWMTQLLFALSALTDHERDVSLLRAVERHLAVLTPEMLPRYRRFAFPIYDRPDGLLLARAALQAGARGDWLAAWVDCVVEAQNEAGLWVLDELRPLPPALRWDAEVGDPSRWLTAQALFVLRAFYGE